MIYNERANLLVRLVSEKSLFPLRLLETGD
jgi:hypothetical protein